jgi:hypothetical protein
MYCHALARSRPDKPLASIRRTPTLRAKPGGGRFAEALIRRRNGRRLG